MHARCQRFSGGGETTSTGAGEAGGATELGQEGEHCWVADVASDSAFQGGVDLGQQRADPVRDTVDFAGEVVVEPDDDSEIGDQVVIAANAS